MLLETASLAFRQVLSPPFRAIFWRALGLTILLLVVVWIALQAGLAMVLVLPWPWLETVIGLLAGVGSFVLMGFFVAPVTALFAALFQDEIADKVERSSYPDQVPGRAMPIVASLVLAIRFTVLVIVVNLLSLVLLLVPGINLIIFFVANGYLLGREFFEFAARRFAGPDEVRRLRSRHSAAIFMAGLVIAGILAVPFLNLLTPIFATVYMVHVRKRLVADPVSGR